jgi:glucose-1-phosphate cytidylyltransferase
VKVVILCGGQGTRLREETEFRPKPMVEIGGRPILWHIMRHYSQFGFKEFVLCLGYKGDVIRNYFLNYTAMNRDVRVHLGTEKVEFLEQLSTETGWMVTLAETGAMTPTGGRLLRASRYFGGEAFLCTYGDGLANVDIDRLVAFHQSGNRLATVTGVRPRARFGRIDVEEGKAVAFREKPFMDQGWVNGGFFVFEPDALNYLRSDLALEGEPLERLAHDEQLSVYQHTGYWAPMDTYREVQALNDEWSSGNPGWLDRS